MFVTSGRSRLGFAGYISVDDPNRVLRNGGRSYGCRSGGRRRDSSVKKPRVAEQVPFYFPSEVEPNNCDFHVNEFLRSSLNLVVASVFGDAEIIRRAAVRRGFPVMKCQFLNFGDDVHNQSVRERITAMVQRISPRLLILALPSRVWSLMLNYATSP